MLPIHLIALNMEHVYVKFACLAAKWRGYGIKGIRVDCVYWSESKRVFGSNVQLVDHPDWSMIDFETLRKEEATTKSADKRRVMKFHMDDVSRKIKRSLPHTMCDFKVQEANASFTVKWQMRDVLSQDSHWRHPSDVYPSAPLSQDSGSTFCNWVENPHPKRIWTKV